MNNYKYKFTVFTPTYNREKLINGVFNSLLKQTFKDFEWVIVDDGSTDNTKKMVKKFQKKAWFPIQYIYQENGGKHRAINKGIQKAKGELFLIFDSDDQCVKNALERFDYHWNLIPSNLKYKFSSIASLVEDTKKNIVGQKFPKDIFDSNFIDIDFKFKIISDKWILIQTKIFKKYPFQEFKGERYIAESSVWHKIGKTYTTRFINEKLLIANYQEGGLSHISIKIRKESPLSTIYTYSQQMELNIPIKYKIKALINCLRFSIYKKSTLFLCLKNIYSLIKKRIFS